MKRRRRRASTEAEPAIAAWTDQLYEPGIVCTQSDVLAMEPSNHGDSFSATSLLHAHDNLAVIVPSFREVCPLQPGGLPDFAEAWKNAPPAKSFKKSLIAREEVRFIVSCSYTVMIHVTLVVGHV